MDIMQLVLNVAVLFIMMVPGVLLNKCKLIGDGFGKGISNLVLYIAQPALIVCAYLDCTLSFSDIWVNILLVFLFSLIAHIVFSAVALLLFGKAPDGRRRMLRFATVFSNAAFMGIPLIEAIYGAEAAIYASVYNITFNLFLWTLGVYLCTRVAGEDMDGDGDSDVKDELLAVHKSAKSEVSLMKVLLHPVTLASVIGVVCLILGVNNSSVNLGILTDSLSMLKGLVAPLSMTVIGIRLADIDFRGFFKDLDMYIFLALRHLALPLAVLGIIKLISLITAIPVLVIDVIIILAATPAASSATMFAEKYNCDAAYVSRLVAVSTILSIGTMPLVLMLAHL